MLEKSCGIILYTIIHSKRYYLLIQSNDGIVGFPKGHIEANETEKECALRECKEETSIVAQLKPFFRKVVQYPISKGNEKQVVYFIGYFENQKAKHNEGYEHFNYLLCPYEKAYDLLTFENTKEVLVEAEKFLKLI